MAHSKKVSPPLTEILRDNDDTRALLEISRFSSACIVQYMYGTVRYTCLIILRIPNVKIAPGGPFSYSSSQRS